jgi:serine/threonine-protein kinase RsbT
MIEGQGSGGARTKTPARPTAQQRPSGLARRSAHSRAAYPEPGMEGEIRVSIRTNADILEARRQGRELAARLGFSSIDCTLIATAISELSRNIVLYAGHGEICLRREELIGSSGIVIVASDHGPGIRDIRAALQDGYSTSRGLGLGLPGIKRIMDEFEVVSKPRQGTTVTVKKWMPR